MTEPKPIPIVAFRIPNNRTGERWLKLAREYVNRPRFSEVRSRPRGNRQGGDDSERDGAPWLGVYLIESDAAHAEERRRIDRQYVSRWEHDRRAERARLHAGGLTRQIAKRDQSFDRLNAHASAQGIVIESHARELKRERWRAFGYGMVFASCCAVSFLLIRALA